MGQDSYRHCTVWFEEFDPEKHAWIPFEEVDALFHEWGVRIDEDYGQNETVAIVELLDGRIKIVYPEKVKFKAQEGEKVCMKTLDSL